MVCAQSWQNLDGQVRVDSKMMTWATEFMTWAIGRRVVLTRIVNQEEENVQNG